MEKIDYIELTRAYVGAFLYFLWAINNYPYLNKITGIMYYWP